MLRALLVWASSGENSVIGIRTSTRAIVWVALAAITLLAAVLRFAHLGQVVSDPFYDGAVRSMALSWHNLFFGAVEPSGAVAIDKPPIDLWLQVASVKLFGFGSTALKLPEALAGTLAVPLLFAGVAPVFGARAGLACALALAVLPIEVITARSDTMDAVMMALTVLALALAVRAAQTGRTVWLLGAAAALGVAFDVKLLESLVALPGLVLLAWLGLPGAARRRALQLALAGLVFVVVALSWLGATLLYPAHDRPWAYGSTNGSAWNAAFVFNGLERLEGKAVEGAQAGYQAGYPYPEATQAERDAIPILPPSPTRLLARVGPLSGERLGLEALAGLLLGAAALGALLWERRAPARGAPAGAARAVAPTGPREAVGALAHHQSVGNMLGSDVEDVSAPPAQAQPAEDRPIEDRPGNGDPSPRQAAPRLQLALAGGLLLWLLAGLVLFSGMGRLHPRYIEGFTPAVAATLGIGLAWATERRSAVRLLALTATLLAITIYAEPLLFGTTAVWWITAAAGAAALALAWAGGALAPERPPTSDWSAVAPRSGAVLALSLVCLLAIPLSASLRAVHENVSDTNRLGVLHPGELEPLSAYLRAHQSSAFYEAAFDSGTKMGELVVRDARPILVLTTLNGRVFTPLARLRALAAAGRVRYAFIGGGCGPHSPPTNADCAAPARWVREHATDVSAQAGMPRAGMLWRLP